MATPLCPCPELCSMSKGLNVPEGDVFICYSDSEKDFVHQLHVDLARHNITSSYVHISSPCAMADQSSPEDPHFLCHIKNYRVAVLVYSPSFFKGEGKKSMSALAKIVRAQEQGNLHVNILPLFYLISHRELYDQLKKSEFSNNWEETYREELKNVLKTIKGVNSISRMSEYTNDVAYREDIVTKIVQLLPPNLSFDVSHVQGRDRLCLEIEEMFKKVEETDGVKMLVLHGIAGCGKTTICKCLCNFYEAEFKGKVFHLEFGSETLEQTRKRLLQVVAPHFALPFEDQRKANLRERMKNHKVFLALDNADAELMKFYLELRYKEGTKILVTSEQANIFKSGCLHPVPGLEEDEAINILLNDTLVDRKELSSQQEDALRIFLKKCISSDTYNPLELKEKCENCCRMFGSDPTKWKEIPNLIDLHSVPDKLQSYCYLLTSYLQFCKNNHALFLGMNILFARIFLNELLDMHYILAKAFLIQLLNGIESKGLIPFLGELLNKDECKQLIRIIANESLTSVAEEVRNADFKRILNRENIKNFGRLFKKVLRRN